MSKVAFIFPGQGAQFIGMGKELSLAFREAKDVFDEVDEVLKQKLSKLIFEGDAEELTQTSNAQPAIMAVSKAVMTVLVMQGGKQINEYCSFVAGHSLGEYSALSASEACNLSDTVKLLRIRGDAMEAASIGQKGAMLALIGADFEAAQKLCDALANTGVIVIANDNGAGQIVLSGMETSIDMALEKYAEFGIKRAIKLKVSAAFHSPLIKDAADIMANALKDAEFSTPLVPLVQNITALPTLNVSDIKTGLVEQVCSKVRWRETIEYLHAHGVDQFVEVGPGNVLSNIVKRMLINANSTSLEKPNDIELFLGKV